MCISTETKDIIWASIKIFFNAKVKTNWSNCILVIKPKIRFHLIHVFLEHCRWFSAVNNKTLTSKGVKSFYRYCAKRAHRSCWRTYPINADLGIWVARCQVCFRSWGGALGGDSIALALKSAFRFIPTLHITALKGTIWCAAWTLTGTAREKFWEMNALFHLMKNVLIKKILLMIHYC